MPSIVSTTTPGNEQGVLYATSTSGAVNTYYSLTSTSSVIYAIPSQSGLGYLASIGSATSTIQAPIIAAVSSATTTNCSASINGAQFYNTANSHLWLCTGAGPGWTFNKVIEFTYATFHSHRLSYRRSNLSRRLRHLNHRGQLPRRHPQPSRRCRKREHHKHGCQPQRSQLGIRHSSRHTRSNRLGYHDRRHDGIQHDRVFRGLRPRRLRHHDRQQRSHFDHRCFLDPAWRGGVRDHLEPCHRAPRDTPFSSAPVRPL